MKGCFKTVFTSQAPSFFGLTQARLVFCAINPLRNPCTARELAVGVRDLNHGHGAAGMLPDGHFPACLFFIRIAGAVVFRSEQKPALPVEHGAAHGIAVVELIQNFFSNFIIYRLLSGYFSRNKSAKG